MQTWMAAGLSVLALGVVLRFADRDYALQRRIAQSDGVVWAQALRKLFIASRRIDG